MSRAILRRAILLLPAWTCVDQCHARPTSIWSGAGRDNLWSNPLNWTDEVIPNNDGAADVAFAGRARLSPSVDLPWSINSLSFNQGAGAFLLGGSTLSVGGGGIVNGSANVETINSAILLTAPHDWNAAAGPLVFGGQINNGGNLLRSFGTQDTTVRSTIAGSGGLGKYDGSSLVLGSGAADIDANTYTGLTTIYAGTMTLDKAAGTVAIPGDLVSNGGIVTANRSGQLSTSSNLTLAGGVINFGDSATIGSFTAISGSYNANADTLNLTSSAPYALTVASGIWLSHFNFTSTSGGGINLPVGGGSSTTIGNISVGGAYRTVNVADGSAAEDLVISGVISGRGGIVKTGPGTLTLANTSNSFLGSIFIQQGRLDVPSDASLGSDGNVNGPGTIRYTANSISSRTFDLAGGTLEVADGTRTLTLLGAHVSGALLAGNINFYDGTLVTDSTTSPLYNYQASSSTLINLTNNGSIVTLDSSWNIGTNTANSGLTVHGTLNLSNFVNNGIIWVPDGTIVNSGAPLVTGPGSFFLIEQRGTVTLGGQNLELRGGLLRNEGVISGTTNITNSGAAEGPGLYGPVNVLNGGTFSPGLYVGPVSTGAATWGPGGSYVFDLRSAVEPAGSNKDLWNINGNLSITAGNTPASRFVLSLYSRNAFNGNDKSADFDNAQNYSWLIAAATTGISGFAADKFTIDSSHFINPLAGGSFSLSQTGNNLFLNFTHAQPQWSLNGTGSWNVALHWNPAIVPNDPHISANFLGVIQAPSSAILAGDQTVGAIYFDNPNSYTLDGSLGGTLTIAGGFDPNGNDISVANGTHTITAPVVIAGSTNAILSSSGALNLSGGLSIAARQTLSRSKAGTLTISGPQVHGLDSSFTATGGLTNINSNAGIPAAKGVRAVANLSVNVNGDGHISLGADQDLQNLDITIADGGPQQLDLNSPHSHGDFRSVRIHSDDLTDEKTVLARALRNANQPNAADATDGIYDSGQSFHANSRIGLALGEDLNGDRILLMRLTTIGDLNLDGSVTISDFIDLASNFNSGGDVSWQEGDLNYDGTVTISDFIDLASNFNTSYSGEVFPISPEDQQTRSSFAAPSGASAVPEPVALLLPMAFSLFARRGRRR